MIIVGLGYKARSGKDTLAGILCREYGFVRLAFADPLKEACRAIFGLSDEQLHGGQKEKVDPFWQDTPRKILQLVGTECLRRGYSDSVWVRALERRARKLDRVVVTDVRYQNEAEAISDWGGYLIRVNRDAAGASGGVAGHASESSLADWDGWDVVIGNNGTLSELAHFAARAMDFLGIRKPNDHTDPQCPPLK